MIKGAKDADQTEGEGEEEGGFCEGCQYQCHREASDIDNQCLFGSYSVNEVARWKSTQTEGEIGDGVYPAYCAQTDIEVVHDGDEHSGEG